jgi:hypothetical protein
MDHGYIQAIRAIMGIDLTLYVTILLRLFDALKKKVGSKSSKNKLATSTSSAWRGNRDTKGAVLKNKRSEKLVAIFSAATGFQAVL